MLAVPGPSEHNTILDTKPGTTLIPAEFDVTVGSLLIGQGAEKYINVFRKHNICQSTLLELEDADLIKLGVDEPVLRNNLLEEIKNLPIYKESLTNISQTASNLDSVEIANLLNETSQHLYRIYLSVLANTLALKKTKEMSDILIYKEKYASDIAATTLTEISKILHSMDNTLCTQMKVINRHSRSNKGRKVIVGIIGSATIGVLAVLFVKSLKLIK